MALRVFSDEGMVKRYVRARTSCECADCRFFKYVGMRVLIRSVLLSEKLRPTLDRRRGALSRIRTISEGIEEAYSRASAQALAVRRAERGFEIASAQYTEGLVSQLELTDAEVALRQTGSASRRPCSTI